MESIELKFLLKLLGYKNHRAAISKIRPNSKTKASERDKICRQLTERKLVECTEEIIKIKSTYYGKNLLKLDESREKLTEQEFKILHTCSNKAISPSDTRVSPAQTRKTLIKKLITQGLITTETKIKEVWLTDRGKKYLAKEYNPSGGGNITLSKKMLADYLHFLREYLSVEGESEIVTSAPTDKPSDSQIYQTIIDLDSIHNTDNYLPIFHLRNKLQPPLSRDELDQALYRLQASDKIDLSTLAEVEAYTPEEINAGIAQPIGGSLFYITVN
ncbi:MAG: hypothetical protein QNJ32_00610 [Xenococcaceae cyanobacterium MO_167.B27]|nr:hypothetical protein [Xenococcaceae cyanobacterium MO_167.B27]